MPVHLPTEPATLASPWVLRTPEEIAAVKALPVPADAKSKYHRARRCQICRKSIIPSHGGGYYLHVEMRPLITWAPGGALPGSPGAWAKWAGEYSWGITGTGAEARNCEGGLGEATP